MSPVYNTFSMVCRFCGRDGIQREFGLFPSLQRVGSDSKPVPRGGRLACCDSCGAIHKPIDQKWEEEVQKIYSSYDLYLQGGGCESSVFSSKEGVGQTRSERLCELLATKLQLPLKGRVLDIGCGAGLFLKTFGTQNPQWSMVGTEINPQYVPIVEAIPQVEKMYLGSLDEIPGEFDLITLIHVFEHVIELDPLLRAIHKKLAPGGVLLIESPDHTVNPFDLLIADHCNHFSLQTIRTVVSLHQYDVSFTSNDWIQKEITILAKVNGQNSNEIECDKDSFERVSKQLQWLRSVVDKADSLSTHDSFGIFGSSNAAGWILDSLQRKPKFLVDEDPARDGRSHLGVPIISPEKVPSGSLVLMSISPMQAAQVAGRLAVKFPSVQWVTFEVDGLKI